MKTSKQFLTAAIVAGCIVAPAALGQSATTTATTISAPAAIVLSQDAADKAPADSKAGQAQEATVREIVEAMQQWMQSQQPSDDPAKAMDIERRWREFATEQLARVKVEQLTAKQIEDLMPLLQADDAAMQATAQRVKHLAGGTDVDAARAALLHVQFVFQQEMQQEPGPEGYDRIRQAIAAAMRHPAVGDLLEEPSGSMLLQALTYLDVEIVGPLKDDVVALGKHINEDLSPQALLGAAEYLAALENVGASEEQQTAARKHMADLLAHAQEVVGSSNPELAQALQQQARYLNLIDNPAPPITFAWYSGDEQVKSLEDLKGKVVVLDFWATWCGPCVGSFPNVRELRKYYEGYDVEIIGVTSLQGRHVDHKNRQQVVTQGDPAKEYELMGTFMKDMDMTWNVAFSEQNVFNADFGVRGIPHMAIIDAQGKVRYNGLYPGGELEDKAKKIDALLKEAKLPVPTSEG